MNTTHIHLSAQTKGYEAHLSSVISSGILGLNLLSQTKMQQTGTEIIQNQCILERVSRLNTVSNAASYPDGAAMTLLGRKDLLE